MRRSQDMLWNGVLRGCAVMLVLAAEARAANVWDGGGGGSDTKWSTDANWDDNNVPASDSVVTFGTGGTEALIDSAGGSRTNAQLVFNTAAFEIKADPGQSLTLNGSIGITQAFSTATMATNTISAPITLSGSQTWFAQNVSEGKSVIRATGAISGAGQTLTFKANTIVSSGGAGLFVLSGTNTLDTLKCDALLNDGNIWVEAVDGVGLPANAHLWLENGVFVSTGTFNRTFGSSGAGKVRIGTGGFAARGGPLTVDFNAAGVDLISWSGNQPVGGYYLCNSRIADSKTTYIDNFNLNGGERRILVWDNPDSVSDYVEFSGALTNGSLFKPYIRLSDVNSLLVLSGQNTNLASVYITDGVLRAQQGVGLPTDAYLRFGDTVTGDPRLETFGNFNWTLGSTAGKLHWDRGGFSAHGGDLTVDLNTVGVADNFVWASTTDFLGNTRPMSLSSPYANGKVILKDNIDLNGAARTLYVYDNVSSTNDGAEIQGIISGTGAGIIKRESGLLILSGANSFTGAVEILSGVVRAQNGVGLYTSGNIRFNGRGTLECSGTLNRTVSTTAYLPGGVQWIGTAGGFSAKGGPLLVDLNTLGSREILTAASGGFGSILLFGSVYADNVVEFYDHIKNGNGALTFVIDVTDNPDSDADFARISGEIQSGGGTGVGNGIAKAGSGLLELTTNNAYKGTTLISNGTLRVANTTGSATGTNWVHVLSGATLSGNGIIAGVVTNAGTIAPGNPYGTLTCQSNVFFGAGSTLAIELAGAASYDKLSVGRDVTLGGTLTVTLTNGYAPAGDEVFDILDWGGNLSGAFAATNLPTVEKGVWVTTNLYVSGQISLNPKPRGTVVSIR